MAENPGVWGHGGGVIIEEHCTRCDATRTTDTWAQDGSTGQQGLTSVSYGIRQDEDDVIPCDDDEQSSRYRSLTASPPPFFYFILIFSAVIIF